LRVFTACIARVKAAWPGAIVHAANSAAVLRHPDAHLDMARCGIALYGLSPFQTSSEEDGLRPALTWTSTVAAVKPIDPGAAAGYGHTYRAEGTGRLALVPLGYADGLRRSLGNRGQVLVAGRRQPIVGRVSMDSFLVALDDDLAVSAGDAVTLLGRDGDARMPVEEMAALLGTINYEVTCSLALRRAHRAFVGTSGE
jgi:alanine racemase